MRDVAQITDVPTLRRIGRSRCPCLALRQGPADLERNGARCGRVRRECSGEGDHTASTDTVVRDIDGMWQDEGFAPGPVNENLDGVRRALFQSYLHVVDWADDAHVARAVRVFETVLAAATRRKWGSFARSLNAMGIGWKTTGGSWQELIESTANVVLRERGLPVDDRADVPQMFLS